MVFVVVDCFKFQIWVVFRNLTELQFQICKNSFIDDFPSESGGDDYVVVAEVYRMACFLVPHGISMPEGHAGCNCIPDAHARGFMLLTKWRTRFVQQLRRRHRQDCGFDAIKGAKFLLITRIPPAFLCLWPGA